MNPAALRGVSDAHSAAAGVARTGVRADVQGLRGIAVLVVVLYHSGVPSLSGGFVGVDVFFVISGFLITGLLLREAAANGGRIAYAHFFARRSRRLLPAALVCTVVTVAVTLWLFPPMEQREVVSAARASAMYLANHWLAGRSVDYLAGDADANPLLHMWSLAVEEQFYLVWPWVIGVGLLWSAGKRLALTVASLSVLSLVACALVTWRSQPLAFFVMPFRAWEFGMGALVQLALTRRSDPGTGVGAKAVGWAGLALIAASVTLLDTSRLYPGFWALIPTLGTVGVLWGIHRSEGGCGALLSAPALRAIGDVSYSWYLWHWPFLVFAGVLVSRPGPAIVAAAVALSLLAAVVSYRWIETPIRQSPPAWLRANQSSIATALGASLLVAGVCTAAASWIASRAMDPMQRQLAEAAVDIPKVYAAGCHATFAVTDLPRCAFGAVGAPTKVVLFGDSHAAQWFPALEQLALERHWELISLTKSLCPAANLPVYSEVLRRPYAECEAWRERMFQRIAAERPALVIVSNASQHAGAAEWQAAVAGTVDRLGRTGAHQLWVQDTPWPGFNGPRCLARAQWQGRVDSVAACGFERDAVMAPSAPAAGVQREAVARSPDARTLDLTTVVCPDAHCAIWRAGGLVYSDGNHVAASWAARQGDRFARALEGWSIGPPQ